MTFRGHPMWAAAVVTAVAVAYIVIQGGASRPTPQLSRPAHTGTPMALPPPPPAARDMLDGRVRLELSDDQVSRLVELDREWENTATALGTSVEAARAEFSRFMEARGGRSASVAEIQRQSEEFRELSAEWRQRRVGHATAAAALLNESQRRTLASMRARSGDK